MELSGSAHPRLVHRLLQLGEFAREVDAELALHGFLNVGGIHLALDMRPSDAAQVHLECIGSACSWRVAAQVEP